MCLDSMRCYAQIHNYTFLLAFGEHYEKVCPHKQVGKGPILIIPVICRLFSEGTVSWLICFLNMTI